MINRIYIQNFKIFESLPLELNSDLNIIVGNNEAGKSTVLEAISLALTKRINGKPIETELTSNLFNKTCEENYLKSITSGNNPELPKIIIELYLSDLPELQNFKGSNNTEKSNSIGIKLVIEFNNDYKEEYAKLLEDRSQIKAIPTEYYTVHWYKFDDNAFTARNLPICHSYIDATTIRLQSGTDYYLQNIINNGLDVKERVALSIEYRKLKEQFSNEKTIKNINKKLTQHKETITNKDLTISIDMSQKSNWETSLVPHLDNIPFQFIGKGAQNALKIMLALERKADDSHIILIEEPENHLSFSSMNKLIKKIKDKYLNKQIIIATHSAYVLNLLGMEKVILLKGNDVASLTSLPEDTQEYFKKLSGYDTLRLILARKTILVEGPSDELIVQKAYLLKHNKLPIENGVDVINVHGLSFTRFLDIAKELKNDVVVVTDNDGKYQKKVIDKYKDYQSKNIKIFADSDDNFPTLEPQIVRSNKIGVLNKIFGTEYTNKEDLVEYMKDNKTECALKIFETTENIQFPNYVQDAVKEE